MAKTLTPDELKRKLDSGAAPLLLDVRRVDDRDKGGPALPGATWRDPAQMEVWARDIPAGSEVALFCVRGGGVSQSVQATLEARGVTARYIEGGVAAWNEAEALAADPDVALLVQQGVDERGLRHAVQVASIALTVARGLTEAVDFDLVRRGALLHDLGKVRDAGNLHGVAGAELGRELGLPEPVLACIEKHVRHGIPEAEAAGYGLPFKDYAFVRVEERMVSYADKLADILEAGLAESLTDARARLPEILAANLKLAKDEATLDRYATSWRLLEGKA
jgi:uncharacterized protein